MTRYIRVALLSFTSLIFLLLVGCGNNNQPLTYASHVWPGYEFVFLSKQLGFLNQDKVQIQETLSATDSLELVVSGKVDAAALTLDEVIKARSLGAELKVIAVFDISAGADMVVCKTHSKDLSHLKGFKIGVETSALGSLVLNQVLEEAGLTLKDVQVVNLTIDQQEKAWDEGKVDTVVTYEPVATKLMNKGGARIFDSREMPEMILDVLAIRKDALDKKQQIQHLLQAHFSGLRYFETNRQDALYRMATRLEVAPQQVTSLFQGLLLPNLNNNKRLLSGSESVVEKRSRSIHNIMFSAGLLSSQEDLSGIVASEYIEKL